jgi:hypothetical protein
MVCPGLAYGCRGWLAQPCFQHCWASQQWHPTGKKSKDRPLAHTQNIAIRGENKARKPNARARSYYNPIDVLICSLECCRQAAVDWPSNIIADMQTRKIRARITPYSTAVGPSSHFRKRIILFFNDLMIVPVIDKKVLLIKLMSFAGKSNYLAPISNGCGKIHVI